MAGTVSDSSVLIHLGAIGRLDLLRSVCGEIRIPDAVWREVVTQGQSRPAVHEVQQAVSEGWLKVETPTNQALIQSLQQNLHAGEAEAICLAVETNGDLLLMDETDGREAARGLGLHTKGVLGILADAKQAGLIAEIRPLVHQLIQGGFHLAPELVERVLRQVGEIPGP
jgi:predicted nucleic acid-binding protein